MSTSLDDQNCYKKMLQLQNTLLLKRHDACINKLRMSYIEFLETQRLRDDRKHKLSESLDKINMNLALMSSKTERLRALREEYEASLLKAVALRRQVCGDSGVATDNDRWLQKKNENPQIKMNEPHSDHEQNTSGDLLNASLSEDDLLHVGEQRNVENELQTATELEPWNLDRMKKEIKDTCYDQQYDQYPYDPQQYQYDPNIQYENQEYAHDPAYQAEEYPEQEYVQEENPQEEYQQQEYSQQEYPQQEYPEQAKPQEEYPQQEYSQQEYPQPEYPEQDKPQHEYPQQEDLQEENREQYPQQKYSEQEYPHEENLQDQYQQPEYSQQEYPQQEYPEHDKAQQEYPQHKDLQEQYPHEDDPQDDTEITETSTIEKNAVSNAESDYDFN